MNTINFVDLKPSTDHFLEDVYQGLDQSPKKLFPKYFYDQRGSELFDQICHLDEYYPTRTEMGILEEFSDDLEALLEPQTALIEFGSGSSVKIRRLLDQTSRIKSYIPIDISKNHLISAAERIAKSYPKLAVNAICADYTKLTQFPVQSHDESLTRAVFFPGSTIGNLEEQNAVGLLQNTNKWIGKKGILVVGIDLIKNRGKLIKAYDDCQGVTAAFNKNILTRINRELAGNFDERTFRHRAIFNEEKSRIEMHLVSQLNQTIGIGARDFHFEEGEYIHTESSHKYQLEKFCELAQMAGFFLLKSFTDRNTDFAVCVMQAG